MQLAAPRDDEAVGRVGLLHPQADVGSGLLLEPLAQVAGGDVLSLGAREGRVIDQELHGERRLAHPDGGKGHRVEWIGDGLADGHVGKARQRDDLPGRGLLYVHPLQTLEDAQARDPGPLVGPVQLHERQVAPGADLSLEDAPDGVAPQVVVVLDVGDAHLEVAIRLAGRRGHLLQDRLQQRHHVGAGVRQLPPGVPQLSRGVDHREVELLLGGAQVQAELEDLVQHRVGPRIGAVHLINNDDRLEPQLQRFLQDEPGLGHRPLGGVHQEQHSVHHGQGPLHLTPEVGMPRRVHDVDLHTPEADGGVLGQNGDSPLALQIVAVHHPLHQPLVGAERPRLLEKAVHQRGLAMVHVGDDGDVANVFALGGVHRWIIACVARNRRSRSTAADGGEDGDLAIARKGCGEAAGVTDALVPDEEVHVGSHLPLLG